VINVCITIDSQRKYIIEKSFNEADMSVVFLDGVVVKKNDLIKNYRVKKPGNVGCMLSKLKAWEWVSLQSEYCNIFEDDEIIPKDYLFKRYELLQEIKPNYDFIFLNVLRPCGDPYSDNFLKIKNCNRKKNAWNSNYIITPKFAKVLLTIFENHVNFKKMFYKSTSDKLLSEILSGNSHKHNFFTVNKSNLITKHYEGCSIRKNNNF
jgi:GR25 family glycosyltransferase involved in LPS biosynthesis